MPEAPIDEHRYPRTKEDDVRPTSALGQHSDMFPIPKTAPKELAAKLLLENALLATVRDHRSPGALRTRGRAARYNTVCLSGPHRIIQPSPSLLHIQLCGSLRVRGMPKHNVTVQFAREISVSHTDIDITVRSDDKLLGRVQISTGSIDWFPSPNKKVRYELSWERFAEIMLEHGVEKKR